MKTVCPSCLGKKKVHAEPLAPYYPCHYCSGWGWVNKNKVKIWKKTIDKMKNKA